ncbi:Solute carrier family 22 member 18 (Beckwith-Wiedemann syndrome chromosomal region 1 candidate gene A protein) (Efflux transporter-like protein) (Imprinted multi-membrane-spanning polyspecific transporter-related protein 1) (Organic cation transporter-like protein 2) (ORCTL-2) (Solute carrier family 22 member 1-like) (Tumor-suppressing STF cDNA 5 protein) (Tumor-suppressing subchromosomal transferable fragment candidate gene 5 protein) (p45-Beckwith-Wiedemann region 1 A) (p45-BWR1A) [Durusdinium trenchii]|uniref:Major facilitator superfamily (MFS) profile domain-containing protein n=1 Tax=Durusdinium trenchii TaxID=1381693 RepID=A0ABP0ST74_9DINO
MASSVLAAFLSGGGDGALASKSLVPLVLVHVNIWAYALCFWIQQPVLPYLSEELGADAVAFGTLASAMSVLSLVGGAAMGRLTDTSGAKLTIMISQVGGLAMYSMMAMATSFPLLLLSRTPALLQHAMLCSQAALAELTLEEHRATAMGRLSLSYAVGMVIGSPIGGQLAEYIGYRGVAAVAAGLTLAVIVADLLLLPELRVHHEDKKGPKQEQEPASSQGGGAVAQTRAFLRVLTQRKVAHLLLVIMPISVGIGSFRAMLPLAGKSAFGLESADLGWFISYAAFIGLLTNVFVIGPVTKVLGQGNSIAAAALVQAISYAANAHVTTYTQLLVITVPATVASTLLYTLSSSLMSLAVDKDNTGTAISISHGARSVVGIISPIVGGFVYDSRGWQGTAHFAAASALFTLVLASTVAHKTLHELAGVAAAAAADKKKTS